MMSSGAVVGEGFGTAECWISVSKEATALLLEELTLKQPVTEGMFLTDGELQSHSAFMLGHPVLGASEQHIARKSNRA